MKKHFRFEDRDGDILNAFGRDLEEGGNPIPDPVITVVTRSTNPGYDDAHSVVMDDEELDRVMRGLGETFGYNVEKRT